MLPLQNSPSSITPSSSTLSSSLSLNSTSSSSNINTSSSNQSYSIPSVNIMSNPAPITAVIMPMPVSGTQDAPFFDGTRVKNFLKQLILHSTRAGITNKDQPVDYIVKYSSADVQCIIHLQTEFDLDMSGKTWKDAEDMLVELYSAGDQPLKLMKCDIKDFCTIYSVKPRLVKKADIDQYYQTFLAVSAPLCKEKVITDTEQQYYFMQGLPTKDAKFVMTKFTDIEKKHATPPKISKVVGILNTRLEDKELLIYWEWETNEDNMDEITAHLCPHIPETHYEPECPATAARGDRGQKTVQFIN
ncbi:hypothetical protein GYMLUDRAFT_245893 [Collybiopsis luxurians FD-317 M1]|uniref:Uncharacterized protein n=1 Tax=Collybiopsis luxurians FD-317 M1 TaxID=944289 RepID=A0A0D0CSW9_9AGAR|nr:hypothetical protein GYMLUDRAFT_245893 [Collybiopsis luxurians FD-317 M1]